ncbi:MAG: DNA-binding protein [Candidatus Schekmanbacteria bacterium]|nr:MAG: DNA-binding protein [Candidatus Schekmanbacteria bacterium]
MKHLLKLFFVFLTVIPFIFSFSACSNKEKGNKKESVPEKEASKSVPSPVKPITGKVKETFNSGGYTYINLEQEEGKTLWIAVPEMKVKEGETVNLMPGTEMHNFTSKTLNRTFEKIIFSLGPVGEAEKLMQGTERKATDIPEEPIKVEKAKGKNAYTVAEIYEKRKELNNKTVKVRAKVVKVLSNIMAKNWVHLQDGTGDSSEGTNDLVVTTKDLPQTGDIVIAEGVAASDKDFGSGYEYKVIVEDAKVRKD